MRGCCAWWSRLFLIYILRILDPLIPLSELRRLWTLPVDRFIATTGAPTGWGWARHLGRGDYLNVAAVAVLCGVSVLCYARIVPELLKARDRVYAAFAIAQILVVLIAASGWLAGDQ